MIGRRLIAALACTALVGLVGPAPVHAQAEDPDGVGLDVVAQTAWVTRQSTWALTLAVADAPPGSTVAADIYGPVADQAEYARTYFGVIDARFRESVPEVAIDDTPRRPDGTREVSLAVTLLQPGATTPGWLFLSRGLLPGVYPVDIRVIGPDGTPLQRLVVPLTRIPTGDEEGADDAPVLVAPVITLSAPPTIGPDGEAAPEASMAGDVDGLVRGLGLVDDLSLPLTLVPRPESIEAVARQEDGPAALADLRDALGARQVVDGPYVDVPLGAWVVRGLTGELTRQRERGTSILTEQLGRVDSATWDARGGLTPAAAASLWSVGVRSALLAPGALGPDPVPGPATIAAGPGQTITAVVPDIGLSGVLGRRGDPALDAADLAAELALRAASTEGLQGVVLEPPPQWLDDPANLALTAQVLDDPDAPVRATTVDEMLDTVPSIGPRDLAPVTDPDLGDHPERLARARSQLGSYASLLGGPTAEIAALDQRLLLSGSTSFSPAEQAAYVDSVVDRTDARFGQITAPDDQSVTVTSSDGDIPITIENGLDQPVSVTLELRTDSRVEVRPFANPMVLAPGRNRLRIPVHTRAPGDSTIDVVVRSPDGAVVIEELDYSVRSTAVPGLGVVLTSGAILFLLAWWARHWLRDRRARDGGGSDPPGGPPPDDPVGPRPARPDTLVST